MRGRLVSDALALAGVWLTAGCSAIPNAVVAVPKSTDKPLYQVDRLEQVQGGELRWAFVNDQARGTELRFGFATVNPLRPAYSMVCVTVDEKTLRRTKAKTNVGPLPRGAQTATAQTTQAVPSQENGPRFALPAATAAGPAVCVATLLVERSVTPGSYSYSIYQDGVLKQDPVIVIRTR